MIQNFSGKIFAALTLLSTIAYGNAHTRTHAQVIHPWDPSIVFPPRINHEQECTPIQWCPDETNEESRVN